MLAPRTSRFVLISCILCAALTVPLSLTPAAAAPVTPAVELVAGGGVMDGAPATDVPMQAQAADGGPGGLLYVADMGHNRIRAVGPDGTISTVAGDSTLVDGTGGFAGDGGPASAAELAEPRRLIASDSGDLYFTDERHHRVRRIDHLTHVVTTIAGNGSVGTPTATSDATTGPMDPWDIALNPTNEHLAIDAQGGTVWDLAPDGHLTALAGGGTDLVSEAAPATSVKFGGVAGIAYTAGGDLLLAHVSGVVYRVHAGLIDTVLGHGFGSFTEGATAYDVRLPGLERIAVSPSGEIYVNYDTLPRRFTVGGTISTVADAPCRDVTGFTATGGLVLSCGSVWTGRSDGTFALAAGNGSLWGTPDSPPDGIPAVSAPLAAQGAVLQHGSDLYVAMADAIERVGADGLTHRLTALPSVSSMAPAGDGGIYAVSSGLIYHIAPDGTTVRYTDLTQINSLALAPSGDLYFGSGRLGLGPAVGRIDAATSEVHVVIQSLPDLGGLTDPRYSLMESVQDLAFRSDGSLLVLSNEDPYTFDAVPVSRVRRIDPSTGAWSMLYYGSRLGALAVAGNGKTYVQNSPAIIRIAGSVVSVLGDDGSLTRVAGGGHLVAASVPVDDWWGSATGLAPAADGGLLVGDSGSHRVLEIHPLPQVTALPSASNVQSSSAASSPGVASNTVTWQLPAGLPTGTTVLVGIRDGRGSDPAGLVASTHTRYVALSPGATSTTFDGVEAGMRTTYSVYLLAPHGDLSSSVSTSVVAPGDSTPPLPLPVEEVWSVDGTASVHLAITAYLGDDFEGVDLRIAPGTTAPSASSTPVSTGMQPDRVIAGLSIGSTYTMTATAHDFTGNSSITGPYTFQAGSAPSLTMTSGPAENAWTKSSVSILTNNDNSPATSAQCSLDGNDLDWPTRCASGYPFTLSNLSAGTHTFTARRVTSFGVGPALTRHWKVDPTAPTVAPAALPLFSLGTITYAWTAADTGGSGVASYDVRYRRAAWNGGFGAYASPTGWTHRTTRSVALSVSRGYTYCFSVLARDVAGNTSSWSADRCTAVPLDDRSLTASSGWTRSTGAAYYASTITRTNTTGRTLTRTSVQAHRIFVVATTCAACGTVRVYWNGHLLKTVSLYASTTHYRQVIGVTTFTGVSTGTVLIKTTTSKPVYLDGLALSRV